MVRKTGETGTDNLSRIQSVASKHFEAMGNDEEGEWINKIKWINN